MQADEEILEFAFDIETDPFGFNTTGTEARLIGIEPILTFYDGQTIFKDIKDFVQQIFDFYSFNHKIRVIFYAHNLSFDFYYVFNEVRKSMAYEFIDLIIVNSLLLKAKIFVDQNFTVQFQDTFGLFRTSLRKIGEALGFPKLDTPLDLQDFDDPRWETYLRRDCKIVSKAIEWYKLNANHLIPW